MAGLTARNRFRIGAGLRCNLQPGGATFALNEAGCIAALARR